MIAGTLDKIWEEIQNLENENPAYPMYRRELISKDEVLEIIDKYREAKNE